VGTGDTFGKFKLTGACLQLTSIWC